MKGLSANSKKEPEGAAKVARDRQRISRTLVVGQIVRLLKKLARQPLAMVLVGSEPPSRLAALSGSAEQLKREQKAARRT